jgi:hypothetical protein
MCEQSMRLYNEKLVFLNCILLFKLHTQNSKNNVLSSLFFDVLIKVDRMLLLVNSRFWQFTKVYSTYNLRMTYAI